MSQIDADENEKILIMSEFRKATKLSEVAAVIDLEPLGLKDKRYENLAAGRGGSNELAELRECLKNYDASDNRFAKIAFTGHRGSGKTTELYRLEDDVSDRFTTVHFTADEALLGEYDYTDLFLWLVDEIVRKFEADGMPLDRQLAEQVARWFDAVTMKQTDKVTSEIKLETEASAGVKTGLFGLSLGIFAKLKSMMKGSTERRKEIRRDLQNKSSELIAGVNLLLDNAHKVLAENNKPANLLIVIDNLDRLTPEVSGPLFFENGEFLKQPRAHLIYTVPVATALDPSMNIDMVFDRTFTLSIVKVRDPAGRLFKKGLDALVETVAKRVEIDAVFAKRDVVRKLAEMSGGSVRDLMRLIGNAQLSAAADGKTKIDAASVKRAVLKIRLSFERLLIPGQVYYPLLAQIHDSKRDRSDGLLAADPEKVETYRNFFNHLLFNGSVLEYNGDRMWYDVHPVIQEIEAFKKALKDVQSTARDKASGTG